MDLNQSQSSVATLSAVRLMESNNGGSNVQSPLANPNNGNYKTRNLKSVESMRNIKEGLQVLEGDNEVDTDSNIDCIDLGTEDEYASSVYTARSISPTSRYIDIRELDCQITTI